MVSPRTLLAAALALPTLTSAYIASISTPPTAAAGSSVTATVHTSIYIQNWVDFGIVWGLASAQYGGQASDGTIYIGTQVDYTTLYGTGVEDSSRNSFTVDVPIPADWPAGEWLLVAAVPFLVGASGLTDVEAFNSSITITA
ncbi:Uu.00g083850.m01.CDS01 [Anthostomella pinea]|uniref:Uu.00g083850.m01.CDS01 n=1 Tax=Anthostomella pinea TaxID=933095 RepID=A0AAI8YH88_9PEZI|nr:Uu.00g083850.m01.CDS01 [Anthostomella pinea]